MDNFYKLNGFAEIGAILSDFECTQVSQQFTVSGVAGCRSLLSESWCAELAIKLQERLLPFLTTLSGKRAVQCSLFQKTSDANWLVSWHQDRTLPASCVDDAKRIGKARDKDGLLMCQPTQDVLENVIAIRVHLDACGPESGPLSVIPKSHRSGILKQPQINAEKNRADHHLIVAARGSVMAMHPLLLHSSGKALKANGRKVLHFTYV